MSFVTVAPEALMAAASDLAGIGATIKSATTASAGATTQITVAAEDEVSAAIASLFSGQAQEFQTLIGQAGRFHDQVVQALSTNAGGYTATEAANSASVMSKVETKISEIEAKLAQEREQVRQEFEQNNQRVQWLKQELRREVERGGELMVKAQQLGLIWRPRG